MKKIILVSGLPGSGKSTISEQIAEILSLPIFSVDPIESAIIESGIKKNFETGLAAYLVARNLAAEQLKLNISIVIDAVNSDQETQDMWRTLANDHKAKLIIIGCICKDINIHQKRIEARVRNIYGIPEVTWADIEKRRIEYVKWQEPQLIIDTSQEYRIEDILDYVK